MDSLNSFYHVIENRHSKRKFLKQPVPRVTIEKVLSYARHAPSSKNTQPWEVIIIDGQRVKELSELLCAQFDLNISQPPDYEYSMTPLPPLWKQRAQQCGYSLFELKQISKDDFVQRQQHEKENYQFFGASTVMFFILEAKSERGNFLDLGFFAQNIMLGLTAEGLGSCPQFSLTKFSQTIRDFLNIPATKWLIFGLSIGFVDTSSDINNFIPPRCDVDDFAKWDRYY